MLFIKGSVRVFKKTMNKHQGVSKLKYTVFRLHQEEE